MVPIYICEDNQVMLEYLSEIVQKHCMINDYDFKLCCATENPSVIIELIKDNPIQGIYFLDFDLQNEMNGFDLGKMIRSLDPRGFLTYITTHDEVLMETFKLRLEVMDFIIKDEAVNIESRIVNTLDQIHSYLSDSSSSNTSYFTVKKFGMIRQIPQDDILFFETSDRKHIVTLHSVNEVIEFKSSLQDVLSYLNDNFIRVHRSFIVNKNQIKEYDNKNLIVYVNNGASCLVSKRMRKDLKELLGG